MSLQLRKLYQTQLIQQGVPLSKAEQAAHHISLDQLKLIMQIWPHFSAIVAQSNFVELEES